MTSMKKLIAAIASLAIVLSLASCGGDTSGVGGGGDATGGGAAGGEPSTTDTSIGFSWWGGESRHAATVKAVEKFMEKNPGIKVDNTYGAWSGWEEKMRLQFFSGSAPDVNQINWNWIQDFSPNGEVFTDLKAFDSIIDFTQFDDSALDQCTVGGKLQTVPVSMTGRIFYWNKSVFDKAGIPTPKSLADLYAAAPVFKSTLGDDHYPLVLGEYDRAILLVFYLESKYGKPWVENNELQYTVEEIADGLQFFSDLEEKGVIPTIKQLIGDGADSLDANPKWIDGRYGGIFEWDSSASKFKGALAEGQEFVVGEFFPDFGSSQGGFAKVSLGLSICETSSSKDASAKLIDFLVNDIEGTEILGSERGIPLSKQAMENLSGKQDSEGKDFLDPLTLEANTKVLNWVKFPLDPKFENPDLKATSTGAYYRAFGELSYNKKTPMEAAEMLSKDIKAVLEK